MELKFIPLSIIILAVSLPVRSEPLNVKPGLWETTTTTEKRGARQPVNLDKLTLDQRTKVEKKLADRVSRETRTVHSCLNAAQIASGETFLGKTHEASCTRTFEARTASGLVANLECTGANKMAGHVELHAVDPERMKGTVDMIYGASDKLQLLTHSDITARWLGSDCGTVTANNARHH